MGTYLPVPYVLPGLTEHLAQDPTTAIRLGRAVNALLCLGMLGLAGAAVWGSGGRAAIFGVLGLVAAISPAVLVIATAVNPSGAEVTGAVAFTAGLLAITRAPGGSRLAWVAVAVGGGALASSRSFGPLFVLFAVLATLGLTGRAGARAAAAGSRAGPAIALGIIALGSVVNISWEITRQVHAHTSAADVSPGLHDALDGVPSFGRQAVGVFGAALDVRLPWPAYAAWAALVAGVLALALRFGGRRERTVLGVLLATTAGMFAVLAIGVRPTGFPVQTRHLLPAVVVIPLVAGEVLRRHVDELRAVINERIVIAAFGVAAVVHVTAWYVNARAWSDDPGRAGFLLRAARAPAARTWIPWALAIAGAAAAYVALGRQIAREAQSSAPGEGPPPQVLAALPADAKRPPTHRR